MIDPKLCTHSGSGSSIFHPGRLLTHIAMILDAGQLIFVPSYLDYVRLRSFLRAEEIEFEGLSEYASGTEVARGRSRFAAGTVRLALYTERAHFYHRQRTRGVKVTYNILWTHTCMVAIGLRSQFGLTT